MPINVTQIRRGMAIDVDDDYYLVLDFDHVVRENRRGMIQTKLKNLKTGVIIQKRFRSTDRVETAMVERKEMEYLYSTDTENVFMNMESYDQLSISKDIVGDTTEYLKPNQVATVEFCEGTVIGVSLPPTIDLEVVETEKSMKTATVTNVPKPAKLETGITVKVPHFIEVGEKITVDTKTGEYVGRAK